MSALPHLDTPPPVTALRPPAALAAAWAVVAAGAAALTWVLAGVWASLPEMNDRFLIPLAAAWLVRRSLPRWRATPAAPSLAGLVPLAAGAALFPAGWFLLVQVGPRVMLLWWLLAALALAAGGLLVVQYGWRRAWLWAFPLAF